MIYFDIHTVLRIAFDLRALIRNSIARPRSAVHFRAIAALLNAVALLRYSNAVAV